MPTSNPSMLAYAAFLVSALAVAVNVWQFVRKRKQENNELSDLSRKALAERDSIVVKGAEGALLMMEKMLNTATTEGEILRQRISALEAEKKSLTDRVERLEEEARKYKEELNRERELAATARREFELRLQKLTQRYLAAQQDLERRMTSVEDDNSGTG
jgi:hypothetical protein